jgi:hypothetical protein
MGALPVIQGNEEKMYQVVNQYAKEILDAISVKHDLEPYVWLTNGLHRMNVSSDTEYQRQYRQFWQLNPARLRPNYLEAYFKQLQRLKSKRLSEVNVNSVARLLLKVPTHGTSLRRLQFSFASKLVHMINPDKPVYDSMVERFYILPSASRIHDVSQRLARLQGSYDFLCRVYARIVRDDALGPAVRAFRARFKMAASFSTVVWKPPARRPAAISAVGTYMSPRSAKLITFAPATMRWSSTRTSINERAAASLFVNNSSAWLAS